MKLNQYILFTLFIFSSKVLFSQGDEMKKDRRKYRKEFKKIEKKLNAEHKSQQKKTIEMGLNKSSELAPNEYWIQDWLNTMDRSTGKPEPQRLWPVLQDLNPSNQFQIGAMPGQNATPWQSRGPNNVGGRTRAIAWDPNTNNKVWAGGVTGGLWYTNDITNANSSWVQVSTLWSNLAVTAIAFDPNNKGTIYVGTGEGWGIGSSRGAGVWKSTDTGKTWTQLSATSQYFYVNDLVVRNNNGTSEIYVAADAGFYGNQWNGLSTYGLFRSTNGGTSFTNVIGNVPNTSNKYSIADIEIGADNRIWLGTKSNPYNPGAQNGGGGCVLYSDNGTSYSLSWQHPSRYGRVAIACAPNSRNYIYAISESSQKADSMVVSKNRGSSWSGIKKPVDVDLGIPASDFSRNQAWYDLVMAVNPQDSNKVYVGTINLFGSSNAGSSWSQISKWSNNPNMNNLNISLVHADQHAIVFKPGSGNICLFGTDGGVFYTANINNSATSSNIAERTKDYITTQFYYGDISKTSGSNRMLAGAQDNGTQYFTNSGTSSTTEVTGGDGAASFILNNQDRQLSAYVYNQYYYTTNNWGSNTKIIDDPSPNNGRFINPAELDLKYNNGSGAIITNKNNGALYTMTLGTSPGSLNTKTYATTTDYANTIKAIQLANGKTRVIVGTNSGKVFINNDFWNTNTFTDKTGTINAGSIMGFDNLNSGDTILAVLGNYGSSFRNIYVTTNGGTTWTSKEGNLPDMPVRSIVMNPNSTNEVLVATEIGIYGTTNFWDANPTWSAYTTGMGAVRVNQLVYRPADKMVMAVTFGRGVFTSNAFAVSTPKAVFGADKTRACVDETVSFTDSSKNSPSNFSWEISPRNFTYTLGTDSTSQNPKVQFSKGGIYTVSLTASNQLGVNKLVKSNFITVTSNINAAATVAALRNGPFCQGDTLSFVASLPDSLKNNTSFTWKKNNSNLNSNINTINVSVNNNDSIWVTCNSTRNCVLPSGNFNSNKVKINTNPLIVPKVQIGASQNPVCAGKIVDIIVKNVSGQGTSPVYAWYLNGNSIGGNSNKITANNFVTGDKIWLSLTSNETCAKPNKTVNSDTITLTVNPKPTSPTLSRNFDSMFASNVGAGIYKWYRNGVEVAQGTRIKANANGRFVVVYTNTNGCESDSTLPLNFNSLGIGNVNIVDIQGYPNPVTQSIILPYPSEITKMINSVGTVFTHSYRSSAFPSKKNQVVSVVDLPSGSYIVEITTPKGKGYYRFIKL